MEFLVRPWEHQLRAIDECTNRNSYGLFFAPRCGKSGTVINILRQKCIKHGSLLKTLILTPLITLENWEKEIGMHSKIKEITILKGSQKDRIKQFKKHPGPQILITNHEALAVMKDLVKEFHLWNPDFLILDESHRLKDGTSKRTKAMIKLADQIKYKFILTGTPMLNSAMDIFSQFRIMLGGFPEDYGLEKNFMTWRSRYFYDKNASMPGHIHFPAWEIRPSSFEELNKKIYKHAMRVKLEDCLDVPEEKDEFFEVDLSEEQRKHYEEMKEEFITYVGSEACVATLALTKALRMQQIVSGFIKLEDGTIKRFKNTPREEALKDFLESSCADNKAIVWSVFRENYQQIKDICEELKLKYVEATGEISTEDKFKNMKAFQEDPTVKVFIGHPKAAGIGIDLTASSYNFFFSRDFNLGDYLQAKARPTGTKQKKIVRHIHLSAKNTLDEIVTKSLANKINMSEKILIDTIKGTR